MISVELALRFRLLNISPDYQTAFEWLISTTLSYRLRLRHFYKNQMVTQNYKEIVYIQKNETNERTEPPWRCGSHLLGCTWYTVKEDKHLTWKKWEDRAQASDGLADESLSQWGLPIRDGLAHTLGQGFTPRDASKWERSHTALSLSLTTVWHLLFISWVVGHFILRTQNMCNR